MPLNMNPYRDPRESTNPLYRQTMKALTSRMTKATQIQGIMWPSSSITLPNKNIVYSVDSYNSMEGEFFCLSVDAEDLTHHVYPVSEIEVSITVRDLYHVLTTSGDTIELTADSLLLTEDGLCQISTVVSENRKVAFISPRTYYRSDDAFDIEYRAITAINRGIGSTVVSLRVWDAYDSLEESKFCLLTKTGLMVF